MPLSGEPIPDRAASATTGIGSADIGAGRLFWLDAAALILIGVAIVWTYLAPAWPQFSTGPYAALLVVSATILGIARLIASISRPLVPAFIVGAAALLAVTTEDLLSGAALGGPMGYANANGAFFLQGSIAGLILAASSRATAAKFLGLAGAFAFGVVPFAAKSVTSATLLLALPVIALSTHALLGARVAVMACAALFSMVFMITIILGASYSPGDRSGLVDRIVDSSLDERRAALWHEALVMIREEPATGVGVGGFQALSPTARSDRDARWAHNSFLQQGAETGIVGLVLLFLLFLWGFTSLATTAVPDVVSVLGAVALAALGIHACVDYVLHFPAVPLTTSALVGAAMFSSQSHMRGSE